jgi:cell division protein FtsB
MAISRKAKRELSWILLFVGCLFSCYFLVFGDGGYLKLQERRQELILLQHENFTLQQSQKDLIERIDRLKTDPNEIERIARERYNLARPGDIIVNVPD